MTKLLFDFFKIKLRSRSILRQVFLINVYFLCITEASGTHICQNFLLNNQFLFKYLNIMIKHLKVHFGSLNPKLFDCSIFLTAI